MSLKQENKDIPEGAGGEGECGSIVALDRALATVPVTRLTPVVTKPATIRFFKVESTRTYFRQRLNHITCTFLI